MRFLGKLIVGVFVTLGVVTALLIGIVLYLLIPPAPPERFVLTLDLDRGFQEGDQGPNLASLDFSTRTKMQDAVLALRRAKDDPRVQAVAATLNDQALGLAQAQEIRDVIGALRAAGKPTYLFSESMGEGTGALQTYYLAAPFETIWVQPSANVGVAGIGTEQPFLKKAMERVGVKFSVVARKEYKSAMEMYTHEHISPASKEELTAVIGGWFDQMVQGIATDRKLTPAAVKALIDKGPLLASEAKDGGLVDALGYRDEFQAALRGKVGNIPHVPLRRYVDMPAWRGRPLPTRTIAIIHAVGEITRGNETNPLTGGEGIKSAVTAKAIRDAVANKDVEAIVLRIDSPGGSYVASDTIWREVVKAREKKKPIIASMGDTAASGGYFIAMAADRIFASPATLTGSIGVLSGKLVIGGLSQKVDVNWDRIAFGESAGMYSSVTDFNQRELARLNEMMDAVYADFTTKAAQGRGKPVEELEKHAKGRVWSGADAVKIGLVDELGGLSAAIDHAKTKIGLQANDVVKLVPFPEQRGPLETLMRAVNEDDAPTDIMAGVRALVQLGKLAAPLVETLQGMQTRGPEIRMEPLRVE